MKKLLIIVVLGLPYLGNAQDKWGQKFEQLETILPTPNTYRTASGAPGRDYWQQKVDYVIEASLNDNNQSITGVETITYYNNSPDDLDYLWLQLDQNKRASGSDADLTETRGMQEKVSGMGLQSITKEFDFEGGFNITSVTTAEGKALSKTINKTMMRVDLPASLKSGESFSFTVAWNFNIQDRMTLGGRSGYEYFPKDDNYLYAIAQWFPRMAPYDDLEGWQNKQFLGTGELHWSLEIIK